MSDAGAGAVPPLCATMEVHRRLLAVDPGYREVQERLEQLTAAVHEGMRIAPAGEVTVPVVVHVVAATDEQDVSDEQVVSQLAVLSADFRARNADVGDTPEPWRDLVGDAGLTFELATMGPTGEPTTGITRRRTATAEFASDDAVKSAATGGTDAWPADRYLNLWVCPLAGGLLGYAQFPGGPAATDGVVVDFRAFGTTGTAAAPFDGGRTATHEVGHWLNLRHVWGDDGSGCAGTDLVDDTPNQAGPSTGVPTFPSVSCDNGPHGDMFVNFMDYTDDRAMVMFSAGQVERMRACLAGPRASLTGLEAATIPGTDRPFPQEGAQVAPPVGAPAVDAAALPDEVFGRWYLSGPESTGAADVYRPEVPKSRGPQKALELRPDGTYVEYVSGPADALVGTEGRWQPAGGTQLEARVEDGPTCCIDWEPGVLRVTGPGPGPGSRPGPA
jgi:hypothetical protein